MDSPNLYPRAHDHPSLFHIKPNNSKVDLKKPNNRSKFHKAQQLNNKMIRDHNETPNTCKIPYGKQKIFDTIQNKEMIKYTMQK